MASVLSVLRRKSTYGAPARQPPARPADPAPRAGARPPLTTPQTPLVDTDPPSRSMLACAALAFLIAAALLALVAGLGLWLAAAVYHSGGLN